MKQTRTEFYSADKAMSFISTMEEVGWAVRQIVSTSFGLIVVYEQVSVVTVRTPRKGRDMRQTWWDRIKEWWWRVSS